MTSSRKSESNQPKPKKLKVDWQAVERDYRATKLTLRELGSKHGCDHAVIARKAKKEGWERDLTELVKQATNTKLIAQAVNDAVNNGQQDVTNVVLAVAELNKQVILGHRVDLSATRSVASDLLLELHNSALLGNEAQLLAQIAAGDGAQEADLARARSAVNKALNLNSRIGSIKALAETFTKIQAAERIAFGLPLDGSGAESGQDAPQKRVLLEFVDVTAK